MQRPITARPNRLHQRAGLTVAQLPIRLRWTRPLAANPSSVKQNARNTAHIHCLPRRFGSTLRRGQEGFIKTRLQPSSQAPFGDILTISCLSHCILGRISAERDLAVPPSDHHLKQPGGFSILALGVPKWGSSSSNPIPLGIADSIRTAHLAVHTNVTQQTRQVSRVPGESNVPDLHKKCTSHEPHCRP